MIDQYSTDDSAGQYQTDDAGTEIDKKKVLFIVSGIVVVTVLMALLIFSFTDRDSDNDGRPSDNDLPVDPKAVCGDGKCDKTENCANCVKDCICKADEECSKGICVEKETTPEKSKCGDGVCDASENCFDCKDCRCERDERCSPAEKVCIKPVCGDGNCMSPEDPYTCCLDCFCVSPGEQCNTDTNKCELITLSLTEERARELIESHYESDGKTVISMNSRGPWKWDGVPILLFEVTLDSQSWSSKVGVYEDEKVEELPAM